MPLLRSRTAVHRARWRAGVGIFRVMAFWMVAFAAVLAGHYWFGWW
jgi:hypothetical protein